MSTTPVSAQPRLRQPSVLLITALGVATGLLLGLLGAGLMLLKELLLPLVIHNEHAKWMAPLGHALWALPAALVLAWLNQLRPHLVTMRVIVFLLVLPLLFGVLRVYGREVSEWAALLLSIGVAWRASSWRGFEDPVRLRSLLRRGTPLLAGAVALIAAVVLLGPGVRERAGLRGRSLAAAGQPNVVLIILDTVRALSMGLYGHERATTPHVDAFATRGVTFDLAIAPSPWTLPTHASLFTGRFPHELSATWRVPLDDAHPTLAERMADAGYRTGAVVANLFNANSAMGLDRGFDRYVDLTASWAEFIRSTYGGRLVLNAIRDHWFSGSFAFADFYGRRTAREVNRDLLAWIDARDDRPFFAFANYFDAHDPYIAPESAYAAIARAPLRVTHPVRMLSNGELTPATPERTSHVREDLDRYEAALTYLDGEIGQLLAQLDRRGLLDNTLIVLTSDHGEEFGEHGLRWHAHSLYLPSLHVPLAIVWPGRVPAGVRVAREVSVRDIPATILGLAGVSPATPFPGASLERYWRPSADPVPNGPVASSLELDSDGVERWPGSRRMESLVLGGMHYIRNETGPEELYDLRQDPLQMRNLAAEDASLDAYRDALATLRTPLSALFTVRR